MQSAVQPPAEVARRILAFLATGPELIANNSADFRSFVDAAQTELREPPKRLSQASDQLWPRIAEGTYRFADFLRVGVPMNLVAGAATVLLIPLLWPLE